MRLTKLVKMNGENINSDMLTPLSYRREHHMDLYTLHLVSTMKTELLAIAIMIETDNKCTKENIKESLLDLITRELEGYEVSLLNRNTGKE